MNSYQEAPQMQGFFIKCFRMRISLSYLFLLLAYHISHQCLGRKEKQ